jgi:two-component system, sensor histidine kinase LadS
MLSFRGSWCRAVLLAVLPMVAAPWALADGSAVGTPAQPSVIELSANMHKQSLATKAWVWIDETGQASVEQASQVFLQSAAQGTETTATGAVAAYPSGLHLRQEGRAYALHGKAMWLHFKVHPASRDVHWRLQVHLPTTDQASLYFQRADGSWVVQSAGDAIPHTQWPVRDRYPLFSLSDDSQMAVDYWLQIRHERVPYSAAISILSDEEVIASRQVENLLLGAYFGLMLAVAAMCVVNGLVLRYANYLRYAVYVAVLAITQMGFLGLFTQYITPDWLSWNAVSSFVLPSISVVVALWLVRALVNPAQLVPWLDRWLLLLMVVLSVVTVVETFQPSLLGFRTSNSLTMISMLSLYVLLWFSWRAGDRNARWIAIGFLPIVLAGLFPVLRNFGIVSTGFLSQYAVTLGSAIEVPLLLYALTLRSANQRDMRIREQALLQQDAVTGLSDERRLLTRLHGSQLRARRNRHKLGLLHVHLRNHDHLSKEFGSQTANAALLLTASHLRQICRDIDLAARLEGPNFVMLMEGPVNSARLIEAATQLLAHSLRPAEALPVGQLPKLFISVALLPDDQVDALGEDAQTALNWMISQSEISTEKNPQKAIRAINF